MIKRAVALALLGLGIGFIDHAPAHAAPPSFGVVASSIRMADKTTVQVGCLDEVPVVSNVVAFFELLRDEEFDNYCLRGENHGRRAYDEHKYPTYRDGGDAQPKDLKGSR
jgi:hypothetical protein